MRGSLQPPTHPPEVWLPVVGYEGSYEVSDMGRVKSLARRIIRGDGKWQSIGERIMKQHPNGSGHYAVSLAHNGIRSTYKVHTLVLEAHCCPRPEGMECRHLDGDKLNNVLSNLVWGTHAENMRDSVEHGTRARGENNGQSKLTEESVREIHKLRRDGLKLRQIASIFGVGITAIYKILEGYTWSHVEVDMK